MISAQFYKLALQFRSRHLKFLHERIGSLPNIFIGKRKMNGKEVEVIRVYQNVNGTSKRLQFNAASPKSSKWKLLMTEKAALLSRENNLEFKSYLNNPLDKLTVNEHISDQSLHQDQFSKPVFDSLEELNDKNIQGGYEYDGHLFRSKSELMMAQLFNELGMEYKYEILFVSGQSRYYIDFAVYCPETGRFFFVEHFGRMSDENYRIRTFQKITCYIQNRFIEGLDILYTYELSEGGFFIDVLKSKVLSIVAAQLMINH